MTRLPVDSWDVTPLLALQPYTLNTICPVTGETSGLEDHHVFRRSFTALGQENRDLFWVSYSDPDSGDEYVVKNRVALAPEAHRKITENEARLEYREHGLWWIEGDDVRLLNLDLHLMADGEKVAKKRRKANATTPEERKKRASYSIWTPKDEENALPEMEEALREKLAPELSELMDDPTQASSYWVWMTAAVKVLQS